MKKVLLVVLSMLLLTAGIAAAADDTSWLQIGGDYRFRYDSLKGTVHDYVQAVPPASFVGATGYSVENNSLMLNRFGLNLKADAMEDVTVKARLTMYKVFGHETSTPVQGSYAADRAMGLNDGTVSHMPADNSLRVDYAYATVSNLFGAPAWFSVGRRPSTGGVPSNIRQNLEKQGTGGIPSIMVNYAFDGMTVGYAPDIEALPGAYAKLCYGRGFDSGYNTNGNPFGDNTLKDTNFLGLNVVPVDVEKLHVELQLQKGWNIFDLPSDGAPALGYPSVTENLGNITWMGGVVMSKLGNLNLFLSAAQSKTDPNDNTFGGNTSPWGLLWTSTGIGGAGKESHSGTAVYVGGRYDIASTGTKIGAEYNHGSEYWIGMVPADDEIWTSKLGTRGSVYEVYLIQELNRKPVSKKGKAFLRLGYQYYKFDYTGSNNWVGAPVKISDLSTTNVAGMQMLAPLKDAKDIYLTFDVQF
jgi:hypothetical protein